MDDPLRYECFHSCLVYKKLLHLIILTNNKFVLIRIQIRFCSLATFIFHLKNNPPNFHKRQIVFVKDKISDGDKCFSFLPDKNFLEYDFTTNIKSSSEIHKETIQYVNIKSKGLVSIEIFSSDFVLNHYTYGQFTRSTYSLLKSKTQAVKKVIYLIVGDPVSRFIQSTEKTRRGAGFNFQIGGDFFILIL